MKFMLAVVCGFLVAVVYLWLRQDSFIFFPDRYLLDRLGPSITGLDLKPWPDATASLRGFLGPAPAGAPRGLVIVFHGNAGSARHRDYYVEALTPLGFRVLLAEYPGYGVRQGKPSEASFVADALETVRLAGRTFPGPLVVWGESLGCAVASAVARERGDDVDALALLLPWSDLPRLAQAVYPFLPARWLVRDRWDNVANLRGFRKPTAVFMAGADEIIPERHTRLLYDSLAAPKRLWTFPAAGHNTWPAEPGQEWWLEAADFLVPPR